jgi:hypothetical protein
MNQAARHEGIDPYEQGLSSQIVNLSLAQPFISNCQPFTGRSRLVATMFQAEVLHEITTPAVPDRTNEITVVQRDLGAHCGV